MKLKDGLRPVWNELQTISMPLTLRSLEDLSIIFDVAKNCWSEH